MCASARFRPETMKGTRMNPPLEDLESLPRIEQSAFLALFAGARLTAQAAKEGTGGREFPPKWGKAECERVRDWREFYGKTLPALGFTTFHETEPRPALGMAAGSTVWDVTIGITERGVEAREAYWTRLRNLADAT